VFSEAQLVRAEDEEGDERSMIELSTGSQYYDCRCCSSSVGRRPCVCEKNPVSYMIPPLLLRVLRSIAARECRMEAEWLSALLLLLTR
jgi:hypothetical protein